MMKILRHTDEVQCMDGAVNYEDFEEHLVAILQKDEYCPYIQWNQSLYRYVLKYREFEAEQMNLDDKPRILKTRRMTKVGEYWVPAQLRAVQGTSLTRGHQSYQLEVKCTSINAPCIFHKCKVSDALSIRTHGLLQGWKQRSNENAKAHVYGSARDMVCTLALRNHREFDWTFRKKGFRKDTLLNIPYPYDDHGRAKATTLICTWLCETMDVDWYQTVCAATKCADNVPPECIYGVIDDRGKMLVKNQDCEDMLQFYSEYFHRVFSIQPKDEAHEKKIAEATKDYLKIRHFKASVHHAMLTRRYGPAPTYDQKKELEVGWHQLNRATEDLQKLESQKKILNEEAIPDPYKEPTVIEEDDVPPASRDTLQSKAKSQTSSEEEEEEEEEEDAVTDLDPSEDSDEEPEIVIVPDEKSPKEEEKPDEDIDMDDAVSDITDEWETGRIQMRSRRQVQEAASSAGAPLREHPMMFCGWCKHPNMFGSERCSSCHERVPQKLTTRFLEQKLHQDPGADLGLKELRLHYGTGYRTTVPKGEIRKEDLQGLAKRCRKYKVKALKQGYNSIREKTTKDGLFYTTMLVHLREMFDHDPNSLDELASEDHSQPMTRADRQLFLPRVSFRNKERKRSPGGTTQPVRDHPEYAEVHKKVSGESHFYRDGKKN